MAVQKSVTNASLRITVDDGFTGSGTAKTKNYTYSNIKTDATDENLHAAGAALASLMEPELVGIFRVDTAELTDDEE